MLLTQTKGWVGTGAPKYTSTMTDSKKATDDTEHTTQKTTPRAQATEVCEKTFFTYYVPQPVENTTSFSNSLGQRRQCRFGFCFSRTSPWILRSPV